MGCNADTRPGQRWQVKHESITNMQLRVRAGQGHVRISCRSPISLAQSLGCDAHSRLCRSRCYQVVCCPSSLNRRCRRSNALGLCTGTPRRLQVVEQMGRNGMPRRRQEGGQMPTNGMQRRRLEEGLKATGGTRRRHRGVLATLMPPRRAKTGGMKLLRLDEQVLKLGTARLQSRQLLRHSSPSHAGTTRRQTRCPVALR